MSVTTQVSYMLTIHKHITHTHIPSSDCLLEHSVTSFAINYWNIDTMFALICYVYSLCDHCCTILTVSHVIVNSLKDGRTFITKYTTICTHTLPPIVIIILYTPPLLAMYIVIASSDDRVIKFIPPQTDWACPDVLLQPGLCVHSVLLLKS